MQKIKINYLVIILVILSIFFPFKSFCKNKNQHAIIKKFNYNQNFESEDPFKFWTANGEFDIRFKGLNDVDKYEGKSSFKLDIKLKTATYVYFYIPINAPLLNKMNLTAKIKVNSISDTYCAMGVNIDLFPSPVSGLSAGKHLRNTNRQWELIDFDVIKSSEKTVESLLKTHLGGANASSFGITSDKLCLLVYSEKGGDISISIDNIMLEGLVYDEEYFMQTSKNKWNDYKFNLKEFISRTSLILKNFDTTNQDQAIKNIVYSSFELNKKIDRSIKETGFISANEYNIYVSNIESINQIAQEINFNANKNSKFDVYTWNINNKKFVLPETYPLIGATFDEVSIKGCRNEIVSASIVIRAKERLDKVDVAVSDLNGKNDLILNSAVDVRVVKCWYQAGTDISETDKCVLVPELLLKNDNLIYVDNKNKKNFLQINRDNKIQYVEISSPDSQILKQDYFYDEKTLKSFSIDEGSNKQIWINIKIPNVNDGHYRGKIVVSANNLSTEVPINLEVFRFELEKSHLEYGIYYRGLMTTKDSQVGSEFKKIEQYKKELENIYEHNIMYPTIYQEYDKKYVQTILDIKKEIGFPNDSIYILGLNTGNSINSVGLKILSSEFLKWKNITNINGYMNIYIYGIDEASGKELESQRSAWERVKNLGGKVFVACSKGAVDLVGDVLDTAVLFDYPLDVKKWKKNSKKVLMYGNPQSGIEDPALYRKNYGYELIVKDYDGAMIYAYQHAFGNIWNDFDSKNYRDHVFAYPTSNGVIETVQWEGLRQAVNDVRYASTLMCGKKIDKIELHNIVSKLTEYKMSPENIRNILIDKIVN